MMPMNMSRLSAWETALWESRSKFFFCMAMIDISVQTLTQRFKEFSFLFFFFKSLFQVDGEVSDGWLVSF